MSTMPGVIRNLKIDTRERMSALSPVGLIMEYHGSAALVNWMECDGSAISRSTYADLFSLIGTSFGNGNGTTTFNLPDLRGLFIKGHSVITSVDKDAFDYRYLSVDSQPISSDLVHGTISKSAESFVASPGSFIINLNFPTISEILYQAIGSFLYCGLLAGVGSDTSNLKTLFMARSTRGVFKNGVITSGSAIVTGINGTGAIQVGEPIVIKDFLGTSSQELATVLSIDSESQITASRPAISSTTYSSEEIFFISRKIGATQLSENKSHSHQDAITGYSATAISSGSYPIYTVLQPWERCTRDQGGQGRPKNISCKYMIKGIAN